VVEERVEKEEKRSKSWSSSASQLLLWHGLEGDSGKPVVGPFRRGS
jgi:hypothetical protein